MTLPTLKDIEAAAERIAGVASRTPLVESPALSKLAGREVYLKLECFQPIKVFKIRGAYNRVSRAREQRVVAASSGNHGIAVAYSSRLLGKQCTVVVPENVVKEKAEAIRGFGGTLVTAGRFSSEREATAREMARATGSAFVHPFNDPDVIAGQGTCGLEISEQMDDFDSVLVPVGGGGLISGISIALKSRRPRSRVYGVEPEGAAKLTGALAAKKIVILSSPASMADGLIPSSLGELTFEACSRFVDGAFTASEAEILGATRVMAREAKIFAEPSGAAPLAPLLSRAEGLGERVVVVVSGGHVSLDILQNAISP